MWYIIHGASHTYMLYHCGAKLVVHHSSVLVACAMCVSKYKLLVSTLLDTLPHLNTMFHFVRAVWAASGVCKMCSGDGRIGKRMAYAPGSAVRQFSDSA
jgi:hypothetical protein